nr:unnamed protein product [Callosobruchus analis]
MIPACISLEPKRASSKDFIVVMNSTSLIQIL